MGLEGLVFSSGKKSENSSDSGNGYSFFKDVMRDLSWTDNNVYFLAAKRINENTMRKNSSYWSNEPMELMDESNYHPKKFNQKSFDSYFMGLNAKQKELVDYMILLYPIKSKEFMREYGKKYDLRTGNTSVARAITNNEETMNWMDLDNLLVIEYYNSITRTFNRPGNKPFDNWNHHHLPSISNFRKEINNESRSYAISLNDLIDKIFENAYELHFCKKIWE